MHTCFIGEGSGKNTFVCVYYIILLFINKQRVYSVIHFTTRANLIIQISCTVFKNIESLINPTWIFLLLLMFDFLLYVFRVVSVYLFKTRGRKHTTLGLDVKLLVLHLYLRLLSFCSDSKRLSDGCSGLLWVSLQNNKQSVGFIQSESD